MTGSVVYSPNFWPGRSHGPPIAAVIHTMAGTLASCSSWFANPASQVSAHYGVGLNGDYVRYVGRRDTAWANGLLEPGNRWPGPWSINPNHLSLSIETEDEGNPNTPVTEEQYRTVRTLIRTSKATFPSMRYLVGHYVISPRSRPNCPGDRWLGNGLLAVLADECGLLMVG